MSLSTVTNGNITSLSSVTTVTTTSLTAEVDSKFDRYFSNVAALLRFDYAANRVYDPTGNVWTNTNTTIETTIGIPLAGSGSGSFDGTSGKYLTTPAAQGGKMDIYDSDFTLQCLFNCKGLAVGSPNGYSYLFGTGNSASTVSWAVYIKGDGTDIVFECGGTGVTLVDITTNIPFSLNTLNYLKIVRSGTTLSFYLNNQLKYTATGFSNFRPLAASNSLFVGNFNDLGGGTHPFYGLIDEVRVTKGSSGYNIHYAPVWTPAAISTALWFDADDTTTLTVAVDNTVSQWNDKSGNSRNATQATLAYKPVYDATKRCLTAQSSYKTLTGAFTGIADNTINQYSVFMIVKPNKAGNSGASQENYSANFYSYDYYNSVFFSVGAASNGSTSGAVDPFISITTDNFSMTETRNSLAPNLIRRGHSIGSNKMLVSVSRQSNGIITAGINGVYTSGASSQVVNLGWEQFAVLGKYTSQSNADGDLHELILVHSDLSPGVLQKIEGYLAWKWGLTGSLPSDHIYKNIRPYIEVETTVDPYFDYITSLLRFDNTLTDVEIDNDIWTVVGSPTFSGNQAQFNSSNYVYKDITLGDTPFTIEFFVTLLQYSDDGYSTPILQWGTDKDATDGFDLEFWSRPQGTIPYRKAYGNWWVPGSGINVNARTHIAFVYDGSLCRVYVNGIGTTVDAPNNFNSTKRLSIGWGNGSWYQSRDKMFDELRITKGIARYTSNFTVPITPFPSKVVVATLGYSSVVLADRPVAYYQLRDLSSTIIDYTADPAHGTASNVTLNQTPLTQQLGPCAYFDGFLSRISLPAVPKFNINNTITAELWAKPLRVTDNTGNNFLSLSYNNGFRLQTTTNVTTIYDYAPQLATPNFTMVNNTTYHVVVTADNSGVKIYINGTLRVTGGQPWPGVTNNLWNIGAAQSGASIFNEYFQGYLSNIAIYNYILTPTQILNHYNVGTDTGFLPSDP